MISHRHTGQPMVVQRAAIQAAVYHRYYARGRTFVVPSQPATVTVLAGSTASPEEVGRTALGLDVLETYLIRLALLSEEAVQAEVINSEGVVIYSGMGNNRADSLLEMLAAIDGHTPTSTTVEIPVELSTGMRTSLGLDVSERYLVRFAVVSEGVFQGELIGSQDEILYSGLGDDRSDGLQEMLGRLVDGHD